MLQFLDRSGDSKKTPTPSSQKAPVVASLSRGSNARGVAASVDVVNPVFEAKEAQEVRKRLQV